MAGSNKPAKAIFLTSLDLKMTSSQICFQKRYFKKWPPGVMMRSRRFPLTDPDYAGGASGK